ncbi:hypothetical protein [Agrobacterium sp. 22-226-1]
MSKSVLFLALTLAAANVAAAPKYADKAEFTSAVVGQTISSKTSKGVRFSAIIKPDGTGTFAAKGQPIDSFKWTFDETVFCWEFKKFTECNKVEIVGPKAVNFYDSKSGKLNNAYQVK